MALPEVGLYIATKKNKGMRLYVEAAYGENPDDFYLVEIVDEENMGDYSAMGEELDNEEWESFVAEYGLAHQPDSYIEFCMTSLLNPNSDDSSKEYQRHLEKVTMLKKLFAAKSGSAEQDKLTAEFLNM